MFHVATSQSLIILITSTTSIMGHFIQKSSTKKIIKNWFFVSKLPKNT